MTARLRGSGLCLVNNSSTTEKKKDDVNINYVYEVYKVHGKFFFVRTSIQFTTFTAAKLNIWSKTKKEIDC